jgi:hypothetical protein
VLIYQNICSKICRQCITPPGSEKSDENSPCNAFSPTSTSSQDKDHEIVQRDKKSMESLRGVPEAFYRLLAECCQGQLLWTSSSRHVIERLQEEDGWEYLRPEDWRRVTGMHLLLRGFDALEGVSINADQKLRLQDMFDEHGRDFYRLTLAAMLANSEEVGGNSRGSSGVLTALRFIREKRLSHNIEESSFLYRVVDSRNDRRRVVKHVVTENNEEVDRILALIKRQSRLSSARVRHLMSIGKEAWGVVNTTHLEKIAEQLAASSTSDGFDSERATKKRLSEADTSIFSPDPSTSSAVPASPSHRPKYYIWVLMELCEMGNAWSTCVGDKKSSLLSRNKSLFWRLAVQLAEMLTDIHDCGEAHGELRPKNLFLGQHGDLKVWNSMKSASEPSKIH